MRIPCLLAVCVFGSSLFAAGDPGLSEAQPADGRFVKTDAGYMVPYEVKIPNSDVSFWMEPIPGGEFVMGSPENESGRDKMEGPTRKFTVEPMWVARCEVTWVEYKQFMRLHGVFSTFKENGIRVVTKENEIDSITAPTELYDTSYTFGYGEDDEQPATTMTQYAAKQYSKWMSAVTGSQYRLPTEPEWEYACRAGSERAYSFGDDSGELEQHGWFQENTAGAGTKHVGLKKPNSWGLYDMHGNAAEWVLDSFSEYQPSAATLNASVDWFHVAELDPRVVRGGMFCFDADRCRSAARLPSDLAAWRKEDPNLPKSPWWLTNDPARGVGFRLIRSLKKVVDADMAAFWEIDCEDIAYDVDERVNVDGRGVRGLVDKALPSAMKQLEE